MSRFNNQDCIDLINQELDHNWGFLSLSANEVDKYLLKIDTYSIFERYYVEKKLSGFISFYCNNDETKEAFITLVLVNKKYRGMKIAQKLLTRVISRVKAKGFTKCSLEVKIANENAIHIYKTVGFYESHRDDKSIFMSKLV